ncbi:MAG: hypothetical protein LIP02_03985 [Bacteroidales bacterium]|nr:hypothetical protein [Bacteroidales bacterium]
MNLSRELQQRDRERGQTFSRNRTRLGRASKTAARYINNIHNKKTTFVDGMLHTAPTRVQYGRSVYMTSNAG